MPLPKFQEPTEGEAVMSLPHPSLYPKKQPPAAVLRWQNNLSTKNL